MAKRIKSSKRKDKKINVKHPIVDAQSRQYINIIEQKVEQDNYVEYARICSQLIEDENQKLQDLFYIDEEIIRIQQRTFIQLLKRFFQIEFNKKWMD